MLRLVRQRQEDIPLEATGRASAAADGAWASEAENNAKGESSMSGFFGGVIIGALTVLILGVVLSVTSPLARKPEVAEQAPQEVVVPDVQEVASVAAADAGADLLDLPPVGPESPSAEADSLVNLDGLEVEADTQPVTEANSAHQGLGTPGVGNSAPVVVASATPVALQAPGVVPQSPTQDSQPEVVTTAPPAPEPVVEEEAAPLPAPEVVAETPSQPVEDIAEDVATAPESKDEEEFEVAIVQPEPQPEPQKVPAAIPRQEDIPLQPSEPQAQKPQLIEFDTPDLPQVNATPVEAEEKPAEQKSPRIATLPQIGGNQTAPAPTQVGKRVVPLTERETAQDKEASAAEDAVTDPKTGKPIQDYAAKFENPEAKPLMSIILIDDEGAFGAEALQDFPYPLSFAVSPEDPDAAAKMERYRAAGFEVLALADLPVGASAQDAEVSFSVWLDQLPETVGILEGVNTGIQGNRKLADQVAVIAGDTGRGLVTQGKGLNTVQKLAARNGVPSSVVFRDFDGARQDPNVMRRFLDQAAFRAGQEGAVVMLGRLRPETISALLLWGLEDRSSRVAMAPISAVMLHEIQ